MSSLLQVMNTVEMVQENYFSCAPLILLGRSNHVQPGRGLSRRLGQDSSNKEVPYHRGTPAMDNSDSFQTFYPMRSSCRTSATTSGLFLPASLTVDPHWFALVD